MPVCSCLSDTSQMPSSMQGLSIGVLPLKHVATSHSNVLHICTRLPAYLPMYLCLSTALGQEPKSGKQLSVVCIY